MQKTIVRLKQGVVWKDEIERDELVAAARLLTELASVPQYCEYVKSAKLGLIDSRLAPYDFLLSSIMEVIEV
jgi:hypothetical protein